MKNIRINNHIQDINISEIEDKKIQWFINELVEKYSLEYLEKSINKLKKEATI